MSKKVIIIIICLLLVVISFGWRNRTLGDAQALLVAKILESERLAEVFAMDEGVVLT